MFAMFFNVVFAVFVILLRYVSCVFTMKIGLDWIHCSYQNPKPSTVVSIHKHCKQS